VINQMQEVGLKLRAIVLNRTLDEPTFNAFLAAPRKIPAHLAEVGALRTVLMRENAHDQRMEALTSFLEAYRANQQATVERAARFARELPARVRLAVVPDVEVGVRDLRALAKIASILVNENAGRRFLENAAAAFAPRSSARPGIAARRATG
jgi:hypothetical protein